VTTLVLVTGGRKYGLGDKRPAIDQRNLVYSTMDGIKAHYGDIMVICGGAPGLDSVVSEMWCRQRGVHCAVVRALWTTHGNGAGTIRNGAMLALTPTFVVAFPGGPGTANMVYQARKANLPVYVIEDA